MYAKPNTFADRGERSARACRSDRLVERTFRELLATKPFVRITVADLADGCGLARSTVYRKVAGLAGLLWAMMREQTESAIRHALAGDFRAAAGRLAELWDVAGLVAALQDAGAARIVRQHVAVLIISEIERRSIGRDAETCGLLLSGLLLSFLMEHPDLQQGEHAKLEELVYILYVSAHMTPRAIQADAQERARGGYHGRFPPAVSARESLASGDYILSMIDGRPYRSLSRHIGRYGLTPEEYRRCFNLPSDYPMVAPRYSARRSEIARARSSGRRSACASSQDEGQRLPA